MFTISVMNTNNKSYTVYIICLVPPCGYWAWTKNMPTTTTQVVRDDRNSDLRQEGTWGPTSKEIWVTQNMAHKQLRNGPQSRAPLKWGEGAQNPTVRRLQGVPQVCLNVTRRRKTTNERPRNGMPDELMVESYGNMKRKAENRAELVAMDLPIGKHRERREIICLAVNLVLQCHIALYKICLTCIHAKC